MNIFFLLQLSYCCITLLCKIFQMTDKYFYIYSFNINPAVNLQIPFFDLFYLVLRNAYLVERILGKSGVYVLRKFFGIILLAMSVRLFISNLSMLLNSFSR